MLQGKLIIPGSKSISNRVLILKALGNLSTQFSNLSNSDDTKLLVKALQTSEKVIDVGHAGTSFRFLTSFLCLGKKEHIITGSQRLKDRPIAPLVKALNDIGANITYQEKEGFAPILITPVDPKTFKNRINLPGNISSQFISSVMMIGPKIPGGLEIVIEGPRVSSSYIKMTKKLMSEFGVDVLKTNTGFKIPEGKYQKSEFFIESDWSSASYLLILCAISEEADLSLSYLEANSLQGDSKILEWLRPYGLETTFEDMTLKVKKSPSPIIPFVEQNFINQPDLFQGLSVLYASQGSSCLYSGLETLKLKETNRIQGMKDELSKFHVYLSKAPPRFSTKTSIDYYTQEGKIQSNTVKEIRTYSDHRMAMAFSILAALFPIIIEDPEVVNKSYPGYWEDLQKLGFNILPV